MKQHVIIGCGTAALAAAEKIRAINREDAIEIFTRENGSPYSPTALPYLLAGRIGERELALREDTFFQENGCTLKGGKTAVRIDPSEKKVVFSDGAAAGYDTLLLATGSEPVRPDLPGLDQVGFRGFHSLGDCRRLIQSLDSGAEATIYGGGLVATEVAAALLERGCRARLIVRSRILRMYFDEDCGAAISGVLQENGAEILEGAGVAGVARTATGVSVGLAGGKVFETGVFLCCTGVRPRTALLEGSGIQANGGVAVDDRMATTVPDVYAAGDIAVAADFFTGKPVGYPILPLAADQGEVAGSNMAGEAMNYRGSISTNIFRFFGNTAFSAGLIGGEGLERRFEYDGKRKYKRFLFRDNRLVGLTTLNVPLDPGVMLYLIRERLDLKSVKDELFGDPLNTGRWLMLDNERSVGVSA